MIYYWAALSPPAFTWMLEFFCMIMMYNEIQPWIDDYQVFVWVLVGLHHSFVILQTWILKVFNKNTISALVCLSTRFILLRFVIIWKHFCPFSSKYRIGKASLEICSFHPQTNNLPKQFRVFWLLFNTIFSEWIVSYTYLLSRQNVFLIWQHNRTFLGGVIIVHLFILFFIFLPFSAWI